MRLPVVLPTVAALGLAIAAHAQPVPPGEEGELLRFVPPTPGEHACFRRVYDAGHLAAHPDQTVTDMEFRIAYFRREPDSFYPAGQRNYHFELLARRKDVTKQLTARGECLSRPDGKGIGCGVDCDGGGVSVSKRDDGSVVVDLGENGRIRMTSGCGEEETDSVDLTPGKDDRAFRLEPVPAAQCPEYDRW